MQLEAHAHARSHLPLSFISSSFLRLSDPSGVDVLIIEDLIDTGTTLAWLRNHLATKRCASVTICCLLDKTARRTADVSVDFVGFEIPDEFVVGYGMDFNDGYRCLPYIAVLKPEAYAK